MGVDYEACFGIGYQIAEKDFGDDDMVMDEYLDSIGMDGFVYFHTGNDLSGDGTEWYVVIEDPLQDSLDLTKKKETLTEFLCKNDIQTIGEFGLCGGLLIW